MTIFCLEDFKVQFEKLKKKNSYSSIEGDIIEYFFHKEIEQLISGTRLNNSDDTPYIKKRLNGSGGFRIYFLLIGQGRQNLFNVPSPENRFIGI